MADISFCSSPVAFAPDRVFEVFLSFRGLDTRESFVSLLHAALHQAGIRDSIDDQGLMRGSEIAPELLTAIAKSKASLVIFSENYASSSRCLDELVKILECRETLDHLVFPIFYQLDPEDVSRQGGRFGESFGGLAKRFGNDLRQVQRWRDALAEGSSISGWSISHNNSDSSIGEIVNGLLKKLRGSYYLPPPADMDDPPSPPPLDLSAVRNVQYDVFINFRGEDTRNNFISHLHAALARQNLRAFVDEEIMRRDEIAPVVYKAIEGSRSAVIVFSGGYASSEWCLDELLKILDCRKTLGLLVVPVFYHVDPSDVRGQLGRFGEAFAKTAERSHDLCKVRRWRNALVEVCGLVGWETSNSRSESFLVHEIVTTLSKELRQTFLVGLDSRTEQVMSLLCRHSSDSRIIGISGIGGIGKTTVARAVYDRIGSSFDASWFLENIRDYSDDRRVTGLQRQILLRISKEISSKGEILCADTVVMKLRRTKVLVVLDDVGDTEQLEESLSGICDCFGPGSRLIITTRDQRVLTSLGVNCTYKMEGLNISESLELFSRLAFRQGTPVGDFRELSEKIIGYVSGLPLALKVLGSSLHGRSKQEFETMWHRMKSFTDQDILKPLQISYDGLDDEEKDIFLDIACFFEGHNVDFVKDILNGCGFFSEIGIAVLVEKGLLTISDDRLRMHDLVQQMGREIVRRESITDEGMRSRLWNHDEVYEVLTRNTGTGTIEGICLDLSQADEMNMSSKSFSKMHNLRFLKIFNQSVAEVPKVHLPEGLHCLPNGLRFLRWDHYPLKTLPSEFLPSNLIELDMPNSQLERLWEGAKVLPNLKRIGLSYSRKLLDVPELTLASKLEKLNLEGCTRLAKFPSSVSHVKSLAILNMKGCKKLKYLPALVSLKVLDTIDLSDCSNLRKIPEISWSVKELCLAGTAIGELPTCIKNICELITLDLENCTSLKFLPASIKELTKLERLELSYCKSLISLPELPKSLKYLDAHNCGSLQALSTSSTVSAGATSNFIFSNCFKLDYIADKNILSEAQPEFLYMAIASIEAYKGLLSSTSACICFPGTQIPGRFNFKSMGPSITVELPSTSCNSRSMRFALCAVVSFENYEDDGQFNIRCECHFKMNDGSRGDLIGFSGGWFGHKGKPRVIESDHVFLWHDQFELHDYSALSFEFFPMKNHESLLQSCRVKKCGVLPFSCQYDMPSTAAVKDFVEPMEELSITVKEGHPTKKGKGKSILPPKRGIVKKRIFDRFYKLKN